jgi:hypothetical protein
MLTRLPPRVQMFLRSMISASLGLFAAIGAIAVYRGDTELPSWWIIAAFAIGCAFGAVFRDVPANILAAHQRHKQQR